MLFSGSWLWMNKSARHFFAWHPACIHSACIGGVEWQRRVLLQHNPITSSARWRCYCMHCTCTPVHVACTRVGDPLQLAAWLVCMNCCCLAAHVAVKWCELPSNGCRVVCVQRLLALSLLPRCVIRLFAAASACPGVSNSLRLLLGVGQHERCLLL